MKLSKTTGLLLLLLFVVNILNAQKFTYGVQAGVDVVQLRSNGALAGVDVVQLRNNADPTVGCNINGYIAYRINDRLGFAVEPGYVDNGLISRTDFTLDLIGRYNDHYLQMPVLAEVYFFERLFISVGPEISYRLDHFVLDIDRTELSGLGRIQYRMFDKFDLGLGYSRGFTCVYSEMEKWKYHYLQLFVRYRI